MKKIKFMFCIIIIIFGFVTKAHAADVLYRMLHANDVESFNVDQDGIIVGQFIDKKDDKYIVKVLKVISGKVESSTILVDNEIDYRWSLETTIIPAVNDYFVMSVKRKGDYYKQGWGTFKADSGDYKPLKLLTEDITYSRNNNSVACIEWYVNSGGTENNFSFIGSTAFVTRPNGERLQIYPRQETETSISIIPVNNSKVTTETNQREYFRFASILVPLILFFVILACILRVKVRRKHQ
jgi:hypothetical protein